jgi:putative NIF3 family GTP cyclohydrolase 1 type 2
VEAHRQSLAQAIAWDLNMIICHEGLWLPEQNSPWYQGPQEADIRSNHLRRSLLAQHEMVVYRSHSNWDALAGDGVPDQAVAALGIVGLEVVASQPFFKVHQLPEPITVSQLTQAAEQGLGYQTCRLFGDAQKMVRRFAFLVGGFGVNQYHMPQAARELGAEAIIIGEMSEFIVIAALESGIPVIETLHSVSEIPAIRRQAVLLAEHIPDIPVCYVPSGALAFTDPIRS